MTRAELKRNLNVDIAWWEESCYDEAMIILDKYLDDFENGICNWYQQETIEDFEADCGMQFTIFEGMPSENNMNFCPKCGKKIIDHKNDEY